MYFNRFWETEKKILSLSSHLNIAAMFEANFWLNRSFSSLTIRTRLIRSKVRERIGASSYLLP